MNMHFEFDNPTKILFGSGSLNQLGDQAMPGAKAMVLISNGKSTRAGGYLDRTVAQLERAGVQTAVWDGIMENPVKEAIMAGAAFAREAITKYGEDIGQVVKSKMKDPDDLLEFSQYFGAGADRDIYEMEVIAQDEDRFYLDFHSCPYVAEWQKMGRDPEEMAELCDIAMEGDRAVGASFDAFEFTLGETIAQGCPACQIRFDRVKK